MKGLIMIFGNSDYLNDVPLKVIVVLMEIPYEENKDRILCITDNFHCVIFKAENYFLCSNGSKGTVMDFLAMMYFYLEYRDKVIGLCPDITETEEFKKRFHEIDKKVRQYLFPVRKGKSNKTPNIVYNI